MAKANKKEEPDDFLMELLSEMPKHALVRLIREKLQSVGVKARESSIARVAEQILSGAEGELSFGEKAADAADIVIDDADLETVMDRVEKFAKDELPKIFKAGADQSAIQVYEDLRKRWAKEHRQQKKDLSRFQKNLEGRYGDGLDKLRMLVTITREWGQETYQRKVVKGNNSLSSLDDVLLNSHVRGCQVVLEIITLLENGLADGAMGRWRTLHEIATVAMFIKKHGEDLAFRYRRYEVVESKKAMTAYEECREILGFDPYSKKQAEKIKTGYAEAIADYGEPFGKEYGWASHLIGEGPKKRVTFTKLQEAAGMKEMRAYYQMASYNVHASPKGIYFKLGQIERTSTLLAGHSNAGLVEPAQNAALSLGKITLIACDDPDAPMFDNNVYGQVVNRLMSEIPQDFAEADCRLKRDHFDGIKAAKKARANHS